MSRKCPECGRWAIDVKTVDARPGGALFTEYVHETEPLGPFTEITDSCSVIEAWGEERDRA